MREADLTLLAERGRQRPGPITVVAVDGHSASGKSTFAAALAGALGAALVHGDDFYRVMPDDERARLTSAQGADLYYDWQRLRDEILQPLKAGQTARFHPYSWDSNALGAHETTIPAASIVVVEGLFVSRPELAELIDLTVFVATDATQRRRRQRERADAPIEWLRRWDAAEEWYFQNVRPPASFDLIVEGTSPASRP